MRSMEECMSNIKENLKIIYVFNAKASLKPYMSTCKILLLLLLFVFLVKKRPVRLQ